MAFSTKFPHTPAQEGLVEATTTAKATDIRLPSSASSLLTSSSETLEVMTTVQVNNNSKHNKSEKVTVVNNTKSSDKRKEKMNKRNKQIIDKCADQDPHKLPNANDVDNETETIKECDVLAKNVNTSTESNNSCCICTNDSTKCEEKANSVTEEVNYVAGSVTESSDKPENDKKIKAARKQVRKSVEEAKSFKNVINRTIFSILMAYIFLAVISMGLYAGLLVLIIIFFTMYHEIMRIPDQVYRRPKIRSVYSFKWQSFVLTLDYILTCNFRKMFTSLSPQIEEVYYGMPFIGFCCILLMLVIFVLSLEKGLYRSQFTHFTWTVMTVSMLGAQFAGEINNLMHGMIWFLLPVSCVINNDIWAYICGKLFGRTKLLALSPKKTVEGFVGASVFTVFWAFWFCGFLSYFPEMYCPVVGFKMSDNVQCERDSIFEQQTVMMPAIVQQLTAHRLTSLRVSTAQKHAVVLGVFASLVAPFAGFFASGLKRAFKLKDFGDLIPGHGGMTDRMDCQGLMGLFTYFYLRTYIYKEHKCAALPQLLTCALMLSSADKSKLIAELQSSLQEAGM